MNKKDYQTVYDLLNNMKANSFADEKDIPLSDIQKENVVSYCLNHSSRPKIEPRHISGRRPAAAAIITAVILGLSVTGVIAVARLKNTNTRYDFLETVIDSTEESSTDSTDDSVLDSNTEKDSTSATGNDMKGVEISVLSVSRVERDLRFELQVRMEEGVAELEEAARSYFNEYRLQHDISDHSFTDEEWEEYCRGYAAIGPDLYFGNPLLSVDGNMQGEDDFYHQFGDGNLEQVSFENDLLHFTWVFSMSPEIPSGQHTISLRLTDLSYGDHDHTGIWTYEYLLDPEKYPDEEETMAIALQAQTSDGAAMSIHDAVITPNGIKLYGTNYVPAYVPRTEESDTSEELRVVCWDDRDNFYVMYGTKAASNHLSENTGEQTEFDNDTAIIPFAEYVFTLYKETDLASEDTLFSSRTWRSTWDPDAEKVWIAIECITDHWEDHGDTWSGSDYTLVTEPVMIPLS